MAKDSFSRLRVAMIVVSTLLGAGLFSLAVTRTFAKEQIETEARSLDPATLKEVVMAEELDVRKEIEAGIEWQRKMAKKIWEEAKKMKAEGMLKEVELPESPEEASSVELRIFLILQNLEQRISDLEKEHAEPE